MHHPSILAVARRSRLALPTTCRCSSWLPGACPAARQRQAPGDETTLLHHPFHVLPSFPLLSSAWTGHWAALRNSLLDVP